MKPDIHPKYEEVTVTCSCGNTFQTRSALARAMAMEVGNWESALIGAIILRATTRNPIVTSGLSRVPISPGWAAAQMIRMMTRMMSSSVAPRPNMSGS